jgi:hypothetical protein
MKSVLAIIILVLSVIVVGILIGSGGITGGSVVHKIACFEDGDCNDHIRSTKDICRNPGTDYSICVNKPK